MSKKFRPIILAGGVGKRLWPLSTEYNPKQFIPIFKDLSLFDLTLQRANNSLFKKPIVVTSKKYLKQVSKALEIILGLTVFSAIFLTLASIQDGFNLRLHQSAILSTFGASSSLLQKSTVLEFAFLGLFAGLLGSILAQIGIFFLEKEVFDLPGAFHGDIWIIGPISGTILISLLSSLLIFSITRKNPKEISYNS